MSYRSPFWRQQVFTWTSASFALFLLLTVVAMVFYPGGTYTDPNSSGYGFFSNFFSDLGRTVTYGGQPNLVSAGLFTVALTLAGCGLTAFFIAFRQFFLDTEVAKWFSGMGSLFGIVTGICFIGVAWSPADLFFEIHMEFVIWAFRAFPLAVVCYGLAIFREPDYPRRYGWVMVAFAVLLVGYLMLLEIGPAPTTAQGLLIQVVGQKIIVYASIITVLIQAVGAKRVARSSNAHFSVNRHW